MEKFNPTEYMLKIQKLKFKSAGIPIFLVISGFALNFVYPAEFVKYLSLLGLLLYIIISAKYRVKRNIPPEENDIVLSPIYGIIDGIDIDSMTVNFKKGFISPADFRCSSNDDDIGFDVLAGKLTVFEEHPDLRGKLIGILPGSARVICSLNSKYEIVVSIGERISSGETVIARKKK